jgi:hypothetical protein
VLLLCLTATPVAATPAAENACDYPDRGIHQVNLPMSRHRNDFGIKRSQYDKKELTPAGGWLILPIG